VAPSDAAGAATACKGFTLAHCSDGGMQSKARQGAHSPAAAGGAAAAKMAASSSTSSWAALVRRDCNRPIFRAVHDLWTSVPQQMSRRVAL
jgi:hypothetical protein